MTARLNTTLISIAVAAAVIAGGLLLVHAMRGPEEPAAPDTGAVQAPVDSAAPQPIAGDVPFETKKQPDLSHRMVASEEHVSQDAAGGDDRPTRPLDKTGQYTIAISPQQRKAMVAARWTRMRTEVKYRLPGTYVLQQLERAVDPTLRLTDQQKAEVGRIDQAMKPKIEEALSQLWSQRDQVRSDLQKAVTDKDQAAIETLRAEYARLYAEESRIRREQLNEQYKALLGEVLTAEQMEMLSGDMKSTATMRKLYGPRQVTSQSIQYQNTGE
ncbi:MAG: hypothetical protein JXL80_12675 [Planctomycetes bacterium]|nr:hypothetical protein [Planctomycetota bacterium]